MTLIPHQSMLIFKKDWREISRNWQVILPVIVIPLMFSVVLPTIIMMIPGQATAPNQTIEGFDAILRNLPSHARNELEGMTQQQVTIYIMLLYFFAPFFLVIPIMVSSVIAADSFAGEKERKTIEALLAMPITDSQLFLGKVLVSFFPSMLITVVSFLIYSAIVDAFTFPLFGRLLLPNTVWLMLILGLAPAVGLASIGLTVMISARARGLREAQQISVVILIPILMLVFGQAAGTIVFGPSFVGAIAALLGVVDLILFRIGIRLFRRERIMSKL